MRLDARILTGLAGLGIFLAWPVPVGAATNPVPIRNIVLFLPSTYAGETFNAVQFDPRADGVLYLWPRTAIEGTNSASGGGTNVAGITNINGLTNASQSFTTGSGGSDFNITSSGSLHTFNLPTAGSSTRGALSAADWAVFAAKATTTYADTVASNRVTIARGANVTIVTNGSGGVTTYTISSTGGGGGTPGGQTTHLQVNNGGAFVGSTNFFFDTTNGTLGIGVNTPGATIHLSNSVNGGFSPVIFMQAAGSGVMGLMGWRVTGGVPAPTFGTENNSQQMEWNLVSLAKVAAVLRTNGVFPDATQVGSNTRHLGQRDRYWGSNVAQHAYFTETAYAGQGTFASAIVTNNLAVPSSVLPAATLDGSVGQAWSTNLVANLSVTLQNLSNGVLYNLIVSNPSTYTVSFANFDPQFWVDYQDGTSPTATTNGYTLYWFLRTDTKTNGWAWNKTVPLVPGSRITFTTNSNSITVAAADQIAPLLIANVAGQATLSNIAFVAISSNLTFDASQSYADNPGGNTNYVIDFDIAEQHIDMTNDVRLLHSTNRLSGKNKTVTRTFWAGNTNRILYSNANWKWLGLTNNAEVSGLTVQTSRLMVVQFHLYGVYGNESNVVAWAAKQQF